MREIDAIVNACVEGNVQAVRAAIQRGLNPNQRCRHRTLLNWAAQEGQDAVVAVLIAAGADPNRADSGIRARPLHTVAGLGHVRIMRRLLRAGADPNVTVKGMGTPLILAASYGHVECVRALIRTGADAGVRDTDGRRAIEYARRYRRTAVVELLKGVE